MGIDIEGYKNYRFRSFINGEMKTRDNWHQRMTSIGQVVVFRYANYQKDNSFYFGVFRRKRTLTSYDFYFSDVVRADTFESVPDVYHDRLRIEIFDPYREDKELYLRYLDEKVFSYLDENTIIYHDRRFSIRKEGSLYYASSLGMNNRGGSGITKIWAVVECIHSMTGQRE